MKAAVLLLLALALTTCMTGCYEATGTVKTPYGSLTYNTPSRYDGKTVLPPQPAPTPTPAKGWWPF